MSASFGVRCSCFVLIVSLAGCGGDDEETSSGAPWVAARNAYF